jgi:nucleotide-binding universal stress UspA family protein
MLTLLAPTDFSINSKAGLRFALLLSARQKLKIIFIHIFHVKRLPQWTDADFNLHVNREAADKTRKLEKFIQALYKSSNIRSQQHACIVKRALSADIGILDFCRDHKSIDFICIATRGAGKLDKLLGTTTGNLTTRSPVPVITIPKNYRVNSIKRILYATDFRDYKQELKKVVAFARPLGAKIKVLHLSRSNEAISNEKATTGQLKGRFYRNIDLEIDKSQAGQSLLTNLQKQISRLRPSLIVMFTNQHRSFFQKIAFPSNTEKVSFTTRIPLLSFHKE